MTSQQVYEIIQKHYPTIAGRVIALQSLGETNAEAEWLQVAQDFNRILTEWRKGRND